ncbi:MAG: glycosyltransferase [Pseudomonadota bacterium]
MKKNFTLAKLTVKNKKLWKKAYNFLKVNGFRKTISRILNYTFVNMSDEQETYLDTLRSKITALHSVNKKPNIVLTTHDCSHTGAPLLLLNIAKALQESHNVIIVATAGGVLLPDFEQTGCVISLNQRQLNHIEAPTFVMNVFYTLSQLNINKAILNTIGGGLFTPYLEANNFHYIVLAHEMLNVVNRLKWHVRVLPALIDASQRGNKIIFSSTFAMTQYKSRFNIPSSGVSIIPQGAFNKLENIDKNKSRELLRNKFSLPHDAIIIFGSGTDAHRKGLDIFIDIATECKTVMPNCYFIFFGDDNEINTKNLIEKNRHLTNFIFKNFSKPDEYGLLLNGADIFALTSREDPFPNAALDAASYGLPVIAFDQCGGMPELLEKINKNLIAKELNTKDFIEKLRSVINDNALYVSIATKSAQIIKEEYDFQKYIQALLKTLDDCQLTKKNNTKITRLAFISTNAGAVEGGGSEVLWMEAALKLSQSTDIKIAVNIDSPLLLQPQMQLLKSSGIEIYYREKSHYSILKKFKPQMVIFSLGHHNEGTDWHNACRANRIPYCIINQLTIEGCWPDAETAQWVKRFYLNAEKVFFTSKNNLKLMERQIATAIPNATQHYNPVHIDRKVSLDFPKIESFYTLAFPARYSVIHKGHDILFETLNQNKWKQRNLIINLYGHGEDKNSLAQLKEHYGLKNVIFNEYKKDILDIWRANHGIILTSRMEGMPIVLLGAMLCGRVPIVTDVGGAREIIQDNCSGFIAQAPTAELIDEALERAWNARERWEEIGAAARKSILNFMPEDPVQNFIEKLNIERKE